MTDSDRLARARFYAGSPAAAWLLRLLASSAGFRDFARVYSFFRVADDRVDAPGRDPIEVRRYVASLDALVAGRRGAETPEEQAVLRALRDRPALRAPIEGMLEALGVDAGRAVAGPAVTGPADPSTPDNPGPTVWPSELVEAQIARIGDAYAEALHACLEGPPDGLPVARRLARAATTVHQLRDLEVDRSLGYCNVPAEVLAGRDPVGVGREELTRWIGPRAAAAAAALAEPVPGPWRYRWALRVYAWRYRRLALRLARDRRLVRGS